jgi:hypothetical protein
MFAPTPIDIFSQLFGQSSLLINLIYFIPFILLIFYGQKFQAMMILSDINRALGKLKLMKDKSRKEAIDYLNNINKSTDSSPKVDQVLEYFTIMPVDLDPNGIVKKIEHVTITQDDRVRAEIKRMVPSADSVQTSAAQNILEVATSLNLIYKIIRHYYLMGKKTNSFFVLVQLQMIMPMLLQEADALVSAIDAFRQAQPIGDGLGPMVAGKLMLGLEKKTVARETVMAESEYKGRTLYLMKAEGPGGTVGMPGEAVERIIKEMGMKLNTIIMVDAALKLEGENTGEIAEGIGAAIGGIGVDRFKIEEVATREKIPLYAIVVKQSIVDAISVMRKEIAEAADKVIATAQRIIEDKTQPGDKVLLVGVGNTLGVAQ